MKNLFNIGRTEALNLIRIQEDRQFLVAPREQEQPGYMELVDTALTTKETERVPSGLTERKKGHNNLTCSTLETSSDQEEDKLKSESHRSDDFDSSIQLKML